MLLMFIKGFPMLPTIFTNEVHSYNWNEHQKETHDAYAPLSLHYLSNK